MSKLSPIELEEHHVGERAGELSPDEQRFVDMLSDERLRFLADESAENFFARPAFSARVETTPRRSTLTSAFWAWTLGFGVTAAAAVALFVVPETPSGDVVTLRGSGLALIVSRNEQQLSVDETYTARAGDALRFRVVVSEPGPVVVGYVGSDGRYEELIRERVESGGAMLLEQALSLDDEPVNGRFVAGTPEQVRAYVAGESSQASAIEVRWER
ncbi:MAG: hypothetical protein AAF658_09040 [Myxococcota bacterium]